MNTPDKEFERELARLSAAFVEGLPVQVKSVRDELAEWMATPRNTELFERLSHKVHQLKGAGSTFGCPGVSDAARALERDLKNLRAACTADDAVMSGDVETVMQKLQSEMVKIQDRQSGRQDSAR